ncbi:response regulator [Gilvimarinus sp. SDUM040013]|uniref:Response regulator n=1 Tax=Gilvimarinus gilvus TaxID=3058038 RepID=A0ABU4RXS4_9GAMM|nr:tetratricopeptide repeat-containing response regulator [Gilvimarinus sp. SDUM040013]MDO3386407.1 response regulator [Gilvimarinus sp. SDUM040013]MDX6849673.1 response regulator [Gilvimarinus sp. SDUM040013]
MTPAGFEHKRILVVDDFENFRTTITRMLQEFGAHTVDAAVNGKDAVSRCRASQYDLVLCDYNLGPGKSGQQVLEQLRHDKLLTNSALFVLISAESSKSIVMAAYDYEPDAYLTKPITAKNLQQRLERLFRQCFEMRDIYKAMDADNINGAIACCRDVIGRESRARPLAQKLLGRLLLRSEQFDAAEKVYRQVLQGRELDWAQVGLAAAKKGQGDWVSAQQWAEQALNNNRMFMPAYDLLSEIQGARDDSMAQQQTIAQAVEISPMSLTRQQKLGQLAYDNHDAALATQAFKSSVKLGEHSCYDRQDVHLQFVRSCAELARTDPDAAKPYARDVSRTLADFEQRFGNKNNERVSVRSTACMYYAATGETDTAAKLLEQLMEQSETVDVDLPVKLDWIVAAESLGKQQLHDQLVKDVLTSYEGNEKALEAIDRVLENPASEKNRKRVAQVNKQGIACYEKADYTGAVECFTRAAKEFPKHIGIELNLLQALIGSLTQGGGNSHQLEQANSVAKRLAVSVSSEHPQAARLLQLNAKLTQAAQQFQGKEN